MQNQMAEKLSSNLMRNMEPVNRMMLNLLDSHDTHRFYSEVGENPDRLLGGACTGDGIPGSTVHLLRHGKSARRAGYDPGFPQML